MARSRNRSIVDLIKRDGQIKTRSLRLRNDQALDSAKASDIVDGFRVSSHNELRNLPVSGLSSGDRAFVAVDSNNARFYISNGSGWYNVALVNTSPSVTFDSDQYILDSADDTITVTVTDSDFDQANLKDLVLSFNPSNITDSALNYSITGNTVTLSVDSSASGSYSFKMFGSKSDGNAIGVDSADITISLFEVTSIGTLYQAPTNTQMIVSGNKTSQIAATDTISKLDGTDEVTVTAVTWPDNNASAGTSASNNHGSGTVRREGGDYRTTFTNGRLISNSSSFASYGTITGATYSSYNTQVTSWTSTGNRTYELIVALANPSSVSSWNAYQGPVIASGQNTSALVSRTLSQNSNGNNSVTMTSSTASRQVPNGSWSSQSFTWNVVGGGWIRTSAEIEWSDKGTQQYWSTYLSTGKLVAFDNMDRARGQYFRITNVNNASFATVLTLVPEFNVGYSKPASATGGTIYYANAKAATQILTANSSSATPNLSTWNTGSRTTYYSQTTTNTTYYTQVNYSGGGDLFGSGTGIRVGDNRTDITISSGGTNYSNGDTIYKKT